MSQSLTDLRARASTHPKKARIPVDISPGKKHVESLCDGSRQPVPAVVVAPPEGGGLGTTARYSAAGVDESTGEVSQTPAFDPMVKKCERFALQSVARKFLPKTRTDKCLRLRQKGKDIQILQSIKYKTTTYAGLQTCGSVWACPVCSAKISERRRIELLAAMEAHQLAGGAVSMLTMTTRHGRRDDLVLLLEQQAKALEIFNKDFSVRKVFSEMGIVGQVRALEVTHGRKSLKNNGWHPHYHVLKFGTFVPSLNHLADWEQRLFDRWAPICERVGLGRPTREHGLKLHDGSCAALYATKWGLDREMTSGHTKKARHGETPFDLLRSHLADENDTQCGPLFREFAEAFKGKRQLHWSKGLKQRFAVAESTDEELAAIQDDDARLLGTVTLEQWREVLRVEGRGVLLQVAASGGWPAVQLYLGSLLRGMESP
jgi:hypothetical protein